MPKAVGENRLVLVEMDVLVALDLTDELRAKGFSIAGIVSDWKQVTAEIERLQFDFAILNIGLDATIYPVARNLRKRRVPFLFFTALVETEIEAEFRDVVRIAKPQSARRFASLFDRWTQNVSPPQVTDNRKKAEI